MFLQALKAAARQRAKRARRPFGRLRAPPQIPVVQVVIPHPARRAASVSQPVCCQRSIRKKRHVGGAQACCRKVQLLQLLQQSSRGRRKAQSQAISLVDTIGASAQRCSRQRELARSSSSGWVSVAHKLCRRQATPGYIAALWNEPNYAPTLDACARHGTV